MSEEHPIFDREGAFDRVENDKELYFELYDMFFEDLPHQIDQIREDVSQSESKNLEMHAHAIKSALGNIGAMSAYHLAYTLERLGKAGQLGEAKGVFERLCEEIDKFRIEAGRERP
ncbi:MAG: Hpt domain-containing protein [Bdellovibrionales bacterium]|nr:Hpt domain-containing protein [Bdellovibrionales bacterium]